MTKVLFSLLLCTCVRAQSPLPLIIDADTANEVDDLFALVRALAEPTFDLRGITSAQFHTSPLATDSTVRESQQINEELLRLMDRRELPHPIGANEPLRNKTEPHISAASTFIVRQAMVMPEGKKLHVAVLGPCTNVASAILQEPRIVSKLHVHYLGFWHTPATNTYNKVEFNSGNDTIAVNLLLDTPDLTLDVMTATTSQHLVFARPRVQSELESWGKLGKYLLDRWNTYDRWWTTEDPEKTQWIMWDVALIEALARPELATLRHFFTPPENTPRGIGIWTEIAVEEMRRDFYKELRK